ncbi:hypothetical protein TAMA11512_22390 [Selenomonas sp. TAMA-11512]|uniref:flagellar protein FlgN n=1 Tax=Selenomonas sp. TAMA-11512 TaxID=3095337 RepID=UPI003089E196|nr:hypothetical protein TAMA11512_22390 [Selenomonas sp. TAMA-11512]
MWQDLIHVMQGIKRDYEALRKLASKKRALLVTVNLKELEALIKEEEALAASLRQKEEKRQAILLRIAANLPEVTPDTKLSALAQFCPSPPYAKLLGDLAEALDELVRETKASTEQNELLLVSALDAVQWHLNKIGDAKVDQSYGVGGKEQVSHAKRLDFKA